MSDVARVETITELRNEEGARERMDQDPPCVLIREPGRKDSADCLRLIEKFGKLGRSDGRERGERGERSLDGRGRTLVHLLGEEVVEGVRECVGSERHISRIRIRGEADHRRPTSGLSTKGCCSAVRREQLGDFVVVECELGGAELDGLHVDAAPRCRPGGFFTGGDKKSEPAALLEGRYQFLSGRVGHQQVIVVDNDPPVDRIFDLAENHSPDCPHLFVRRPTCAEGCFDPTRIEYEQLADGGCEITREECEVRAGWCCRYPGAASLFDPLTRKRRFAVTRWRDQQDGPSFSVSKCCEETRPADDSTPALRTRCDCQNLPRRPTPRIPVA